MKKKYLLILFILFTRFAFGQKEGNFWFFGDRAAISFSTLPPLQIQNTSLHTIETSSTICDTNGDLLFYCGSSNPSLPGIVVWNKNNLTILNGTGINGHSTVTQGTLLLPCPQSNSKIYLFHIFDGLYYSIIDKNGNSGNGSIIIKNTILPTTGGISEKLVAVRHANGRDWWILGHRSNNNTFISYLINKDAILGSFEQNIGSVHTTNTGKIGQLCISKNGDKLACVTLTGVIDIFDFDRCTGLLSNWLPLGDSVSEFYGCSISPDNSKLYVSTENESFNKYQKLIQFDLNSVNVSASMFLINQLDNKISTFGQHQIGIDNKIYIAKSTGPFPNSIYDSINMFLGIINYPNLQGNSCGYDKHGVYLGGHRANLGLPNIPNYALGALEGSECDTIPEPVPPDTTVKQICYIPNIFSPNGDGWNDVFRVRGEQIVSLHLQVYNRWGNMVFESREVNYGWDGMFQGKECEVGVYAWWVEVVFKNGEHEMRKGSVSLVR